MITDRFLEAEYLVKANKVILEHKGYDAFFFKVKNYDVKISEKGCSCTCEYASLWGCSTSKCLPCSHILAAILAMGHLYGAMRRRVHEEAQSC